MNETEIAAKVAQNIEAEVHVPAPVDTTPQEPAPSAFDSNVALNDTMLVTRLFDYFDIGRVDRYSEDTQIAMRDVIEWAGMATNSNKLEDILRAIQSWEMEFGYGYSQDKLKKLAKFSRLQKQAEILKMEMRSL